MWERRVSTTSVVCAKATIPLVSDEKQSEITLLGVYGLTLYNGTGIIIMHTRLWYHHHADENPSDLAPPEGLEGFTNGCRVLVLERDETAPCRACIGASPCDDVRMAGRC